MENPAPFDLNEAIRRWQKDLAASPAFDADNLEELTAHLRCSIDKLKAEGVAEELAFRAAVKRIGEVPMLEREFAKAGPPVARSWSQLLFRMAAGFLLLEVFASMALGLFDLGQMMERRTLRQLAPDGINPVNLINHVNWFRYLPVAVIVTTCLGLVLAAALAVRRTSGRWHGFGASIKILMRPRRTGLSLLLTGLVLGLLPEILASALSPGEIGAEASNLMGTVVLWRGQGLNALYDAFTLGLFERSFAWRWMGDLPGQVVVTFFLVLAMDLLARRNLRREACPNAE